MAKISFREQVLRVREDAIITSVNRLLAEKGFDSMTVDEVAADVGIAKASLYKHFASKEALAAAAMVRVLARTLDHMNTLTGRPELTPVQCLRSVTGWALQLQLAGEMPALPSQNSTLRATLVSDTAYLDRLNEVSEQMGVWIVAAQADGSIDDTLPPELVLYTLFARACDPVPGVMQASGQHTDERIIEWVLQTCFNGLRKF